MLMMLMIFCHTNCIASTHRLSNYFARRELRSIGQNTNFFCTTKSLRSQNYHIITSTGKVQESREMYYYSLDIMYVICSDSIEWGTSTKIMEARPSAGNIGVYFTSTGPVNVKLSSGNIGVYFTSTGPVNVKLVYTDYQLAIWHFCDQLENGSCDPESSFVEVHQRSPEPDSLVKELMAPILQGLCMDPDLLSYVNHTGIVWHILRDTSMSFISMFS